PRAEARVGGEPRERRRLVGALDEAAGAGDRLAVFGGVRGHETSVASEPTAGTPVLALESSAALGSGPGPVLREGMVFSDVVQSVGRTPLVELRRLDTAGAKVFVKMESRNPCGSVKDRVGSALIEDAERRGVLKPGATLVEPT